MPLLDTIQETIWTSPGGVRFVIKTLENEYSQKHIGDVKENPRTSISTKGSSKSKKTSVSTSSSVKRVGDSNDTFTDMGISGRSLSLDCYFVGDDHYTRSRAFRKALCEVGKSKLQLAYEDEFTVNVIDFSVKNSLVERVNCTVVTVNFHETAPTTYPKSQKSKQREVKKAVSTAKENIAATVGNTAAAIETPSRLTTFTSNFKGVLDKISTALDVASNVTLNSIMSDILGQDLVSNASTITSQIGVIFSKAAFLTNRVKNVANSFDLPSDYSSNFGSWNTLVSSLKTTSLQTVGESGEYTPEQVDELKLNDSIASSAIISVAESLLTTEFETRAEAVETVKNLVDLADDWREFVDDKSSLIFDLEDAYIRDGNVEEIVLSAANEILEQSYKLKVEQTIVLSEDTTPVELAYEYYKDDFREDPDETLNYLIRTNNLADDEFFLLKRGREIKVYT